MTAPVVGLLFGTSHSNGNDTSSTMDTTMMHTDNDSNNVSNEIHIHDADDTIFPLSLDDYCAKQVELHQAVFTTHQTVGWYRVSLSCEPTAADLEQTQRLRCKYPGHDILFGLLQVPSTVFQDKRKADSTDAAGGGGKISAQGGDDDDDDDEEELPLTLYQVVGGGGGGGEVLVAVPDWKIATSEAERIAVERVISEKPPVTAGGAANTAGTALAPGVDQAATIRAMTQAAQESSAWYQQTVLVQESWHAIQDRLAILVTFLETVQQQQQANKDANASNTMTLQEHFEQQLLLRQVQGLLLQLGPLAATCPTSSIQVTTLSSSLHQLSVLAKTIDAVTSYTDKVRLVQDSSAPSSMPSGRGSRRF
jgi:hypothetical protein